MNAPNPTPEERTMGEGLKTRSGALGVMMSPLGGAKSVVMTMGSEGSPTTIELALAGTDMVPA